MEEDIKESIKRLFNALKNNKIKTLHLTQPAGSEKKKRVNILTQDYLWGKASIKYIAKSTLEKQNLF